MANVFIALPVPAADGVGAWVDVSAQGPEKTVSVDGGAFGGDIIIEGSNDGQASAAPAIVGPFPGPTFKPQTFIQAFNFMRARRRNSGGVGTPTVTLAGPAAIASVFGAMTVPAGDGVGPAIDISGGGDINTFQVVGPFTDQILIETSTDGVNFSPTLIFNNGGNAVGQQVIGVLSAARVRRRVQGTLAGVTPLVSVGSQATSGAAGGAFPGFGPAPPTIAAAGAAGAAGTASRSDHTHRGALESGSYIAPAPLQAAGLLSQTFAGPTATLGLTTLVAGANITITPGAGTLTIAAAAGGGGTLATTYAAGAVAADQTLTLLDGDGGPVIFDATGALTSANMLQLNHNGGQQSAFSRTKAFLELGALAPISGAYGAGVSMASGGASASALEFKRTTASAAASVADMDFYNGATFVAEIDVPGDGGVDSARFDLYTKKTGAGISLKYTIGGDGRHQFVNTPFVSYSSGAAVGQLNGMVARYAVTPPTQAAAANSRLDGYSYDAVTATFTGGTSITTATGVNFITINAPTYTNASAMAVLGGSATLAITGPPIAGGALVLGASTWSIWVQSGASRFDGTVLTGQVNPIAGTLTLQDSGATSIWTLSNTSALLLAPTIRIGGTAGSTVGDTFLTPATGGAGSAVTIFGTVAQFLKIAIPINLSAGNVTPNNVTVVALGAFGPAGVSGTPVEWATLSTPGGNRAFPLYSMP